MIFWASVALCVTIKLAKEHKKGKRKLREREIHSKKSLNLPRNVGGIPRAFSKRAVNELKRSYSSGSSRSRSNSDSSDSSRSNSSSSSRELCFDDASGGIFTVGRVNTKSMDVANNNNNNTAKIEDDTTASIASDLSDDDEYDDVRWWLGANHLTI